VGNIKIAINKTNDKSNLPQTFYVDGKNLIDKFQIAQLFYTF